MSHAPARKLPAASEARRLAALSSYDILDTEKESAFEDIVSIAAHVCGTPISVVNLIDEDRQWFKAEIGLGVRETPLDTSICAHAILEHDFLVVPDTTQDTRFSANPLVTGNPGLRFYAGALLKTADGFPLGTVCVLDTEPRTLDEPSDGSVFANELLLETTFGNLLSNAVKYTPPGGSVQMRARPSHGAMVVEVEDTGVGIAAEKVDELFLAFRQANPHAEGLGLGLWLVRKSTAAMDAEVSVVPAEGGGTIFRVTFATP